MTDRAALVELLARVDAGNGIPMGYEAEGYDLGAVNAHWSKLAHAYDGDVSDALAVLAHLLPDYAWGIWTQKGPGYGAHVFDRAVGPVSRDIGPFMGAHPTLPARALLMAALRAKLATMPEGE